MAHANSVLTDLTRKALLIAADEDDDEQVRREAIAGMIELSRRDGTPLPVELTFVVPHFGGSFFAPSRRSVFKSSPSRPPIGCPLPSVSC